MITDIETLAAIAEQLDIEATTTYSGRGMYGATCFGIIGSTRDLVTFLRALDDEDADALIDPSIDSMGVDSVFYWPSRLRTRKSVWL